MTESIGSQEQFEGKNETLEKLLKFMRSLNEEIGPAMVLEDVTEEADVSQMSERVAKLSDDNKELLDALGIKLELRRAHSYNELEPHEELYRINIDISDKEKLASFLSKLKPEELDETSKNALGEIAFCLDFQVTDYYNVNTGEDEFLTLATSLKNIAYEYSRLCGDNERLAHNAEIFSNHSQALEGKFFKEWLQLRIFEDQMPVNFFHPKYEHAEHLLARFSPDVFRSRWEEIISHIRRCSKNKKASTFLRNFLTQSQSHLARAKQEIKADKNKVREPEKIDDYMIVLDEVYSQIEELLILM